MLNRTEKGRLRIDSLSLQIFLGDLFEKCETREEIEWLQDQLTESVELIAEEAREEF